MMADSSAVAVKMEAPPTPVTNDGAVILSIIDRMASNPDMPVEKIERMLDMHERMQRESSRRAYLEALSALQATLPAAVRKGTGHNQKKYARFEDVIEALRPSLKEHGFSLTYRIRQTPTLITIVGVLGHSKGHAEETEFSLPPDSSGNKTPVHAIASAVSYGKRYVSLTLTGIATDDDDDGKRASIGETISEKQYQEITNLITETGTDLAKFLAVGNVESLSDIPASQFEAAKAKLLVKKAQKAKAGA